ncbi:MAG TPA: pimeloyl-CoA dehydrogenase small subunit [Spongiibacteraceae bacterium]|nr:pimeloyl-CoA dehydrogenase small subunit [Spongiibacteraceae bacterium]HCS26812.1 pimeloyl-CoA dehydrogenase small subunit [Spongiibacteraceae bacterium]|tara:strand:+ start:1362 stop:2465 length:1104 start_codon:yes stop_codon:yes gene_type:complete
MQFQYNEEQALFKDSLKKFVDDNYAYESRCKLVDSAQGYSEAHWQKLAELGVLGLPFAEEYGGFAGDLPFLTAVAEEFGRGLVVEPFFSTVVLAGQLLASAAPDSIKTELLPKVADGTLKLALAWEERGSRGNPGRTDCTVVDKGDRAILQGEKLAVLGGGSADAMLVTARTDEGKLALLLVNAGVPGLTIKPYALVNGSRGATLSFSDVEATVLQTDALALVQACLDRALIVLCAEALGAMDALMANTLEYSKTRQQFGLPIAAFQALQHRMADMYIACEKTRSLLWAAIQADAQGDCRRAASVLKAEVGSGGRYVGQQAIQLHGGIGMTDELNVGAHFKLLTQIDILCGNRDFHLQRLSDLAEVH